MTKDKNISYLFKIKYIIILFSIFVLFHNFFEQLITKTFVNVFLDKFQATPLINIFIIILFIYFFIIAFQYVIKTKLIVNDFYKTIVFLLFIIYFYYRFSSDSPWIFYNEKYFFKYLDILPFFFILIFLLNFLWKKPTFQKNNNNNGFIIDKPIKNKKDDLYGRKVLAREIATSILSTNTKDTSFSIGIYGNWGSGKSSFLKLIHSYLPPETIYIEYNPWKNFNKESIINNFFDLLSSELSKYYFNIDLLITGYKNEINSIIPKRNIFNSLLNNQKNNIKNYDLIMF